MDGFRNDPEMFELFHPLGQGSRITAAHSPGEFVETFWAIQQTANDVQSPLFLQDIDGFIHRTKAVIHFAGFLASETWHFTTQYSTVAFFVQIVDNINRYKI